MKTEEILQLQQQALHDVYACISNADNASKALRVGKLNSLYIAAYMDIEKTTQSLKNILAYKKELAINMLQCYDDKTMKILTAAIKDSDDMIHKVLGMYSL